MDLISVVAVLIVVGLLLWLVNNYLPMEARIKQILNTVVIIAVILWLLSAFGILGGLQRTLVGKPSVPPQAVPPQAVADVYRGHWTEIKGSRRSGFDLDLTKMPGTLIVHEGVPECKHASIRIFERDADSLKLETIGVPRGCERSLVLEISDSGKRLTGTMKYGGSDWDVKAERR